jgi:hypothetical protein
MDWDHYTLSAMTEPRIAGSFLPWGDDRRKFSGGWGIYNAGLDLSLIAQASDQRQADTFYDIARTVQLLPPIVSQFVAPASGLHQPRFTISSAVAAQDRPTHAAECRTAVAERLSRIRIH